MFTAAPAMMASGLLSAGGVGFATVNGTDFATYGGNGVAPVATIPFASAGAGDNALLTSSTSIGSTKTVASLKIDAFGSGQVLSMTGSANLDTSAVLHAGPYTFTINSSGSGGFVSNAAARMF